MYYMLRIYLDLHLLNGRLVTSNFLLEGLSIYCPLLDTTFERDIQIKN